MHELLKLSDLDLAQKIDALEKYGPEKDAALEAFCAVRADLSRVAWNSFAAAVDCDAGPIARTGVMSFPLDRNLADRLSTALLESPKTAMRRDDFAFGYSANLATGMIDYLNESNEYRELTPGLTALLVEFLATIGPDLERMLGHPFRIGSTRQFQLMPGKPVAGRHLDGWPVSMRKLFILPQGASKRSGTTWFRLRDGTELLLESDEPIWVVFENSVVLHAPIFSEQLRPTIEFDLLPAMETSREPVYAGINGWYPWFPTLAGLLEGTRIALRISSAKEQMDGWLNRLRRALPLRRK